MTVPNKHNKTVTSNSCEQAMVFVPVCAYGAQRL
jgi:hypothetical protein